MSKITNKQTAPSNAATFTGAQITIRANAASVASHDTSNAHGATCLEFSVIFSGLNVDDFKCARACWIEGYTAAMGCEVSSAGTRFAEMVRTCSVVKPQSAEAKRKASARQASKAATSAKPEPKKDTGEAAGDSAANVVTMAVSVLEARILNFLRAGKFEMAAACIASEAEKCALV